MTKIEIGNRLVGRNEACFIIAEAGVNHNGDIIMAKKLIDVAKEAGVDAVKFQTFKAENLVTDEGETADYQKNNVGKSKGQLTMLKELELGYEDFAELKKYGDEKKIIFLSTPHTEDSLDFLDSLVPAFKIGSGDLTNLPFLKKVARKKKPIILSTGMSTLKEIQGAVNVIKSEGNNKIILLHCITNYPCTLEEANLKAMLTLEKEFNLPVGYSDHTLGIICPVMAVALGAQVIEKHFTLNKNLPGPDHKASLAPDELKEMVKAIRSAEKALGNGIKKPTKSEEKIKKFVRKSIVAKVNIPKGAKIVRDMICIKRPGTGIEPKYFRKVIGKNAQENIKKDEIITFEILK